MKIQLFRTAETNNSDKKTKMDIHKCIDMYTHISIHAMSQTIQFNNT